MAPGRHPHADQPPAAMMYAIVNARPEPPRQLERGLSPRLEAAILRALEKDPARRPPSARALAEELRGIVGGAGSARAEAAAPRIESIAVLPLVDLSGDTAQEFFTDG